MGGHAHPHTCLPFLPIAGIAFPVALEGEFRVVRVGRHHHACAMASDFAITAIAVPSSAESLPVIRMSIRRHLDGLATRGLIVLHVSAIAVPIIAEGI